MAGADRSDQRATDPRADMFAPTPAVAALGLFLLPLTWWAPLGIVTPLAAIGFGLLLVRHWLSKHFRIASPPLGMAPANAMRWLLLASAAIAVTAFVLDAGVSLRIAVAAFIVSRALLLFPAARTSLAWLAGAHVAASLLSGIALGAGAALNVVLISAAALLLDLTRLSRVDLSRSGEAANEGQQQAIADAAEVPANGDTDQAAPATAPAEPEAETTGTAPATEGGGETAAAPVARNEAIDIVRGTAALAATFVAGLLLIVQTPSAPLATRSVAVESNAPPSEAEIDAEWRARFPWAFPQLPGTGTAELLPAECARADHYDRIELHLLLEPQHEDARGWTNVAAQFERPSLEVASVDLANAVFGEPCSNDARVRVIDGGQIAVPDGLGIAIGETPVVVGAVFQLSTARGPLLLARAYSNESGVLLLIAEQVNEAPRIAAISNRSAFDRGGRLFAVEGGGQLWYGALSEDAHLASAVDIIDVSGDTPQNTGSIVAWGASTCGQTLGDPLYPAEENCVEQPAWAYWLVEASYSTPAHDRIDVIWNVRRQFGEAGEPATYEEPFDELMHGVYERHDGSWRLTRLTGPELNGLQAQLTPAAPDAVVQ